MAYRHSQSLTLWIINDAHRLITLSQWMPAGNLMHMRLPLATAPQATKRNFLAVYAGTHGTEGTCSPMAVPQTNPLQNAVSSQSGGVLFYSKQFTELDCVAQGCMRRKLWDGRDRRLASSYRKGLSLPTFFQSVSHQTNQAPLYKPSTWGL